MSGVFSRIGKHTDSVAQTQVFEFEDSSRAKDRRQSSSSITEFRTHITTPTARQLRPHFHPGAFLPAMEVISDFPQHIPAYRTLIPIRKRNPPVVRAAGKVV
jgi:hypothetical protein